MKKKTIFICDFCGYSCEDEEQMKLHEAGCPHNIKNQPCARCKHMCIIGGCSKSVDIAEIDNKKVVCMFFEDGEPNLTPFGF